MKKQATWTWENRTKVIGYLGAALAQLGTTGLITNGKAIAWIAFVASLCTLAVGHLNDWLKTRNSTQPETPQ